MQIDKVKCQGEIVNKIINFAYTRDNYEKCARELCARAIKNNYAQLLNNYLNLLVCDILSVAPCTRTCYVRMLEVNVKWDSTW